MIKRHHFSRRSTSSSASVIPNAPRRVFHVGVTGHRPNQLDIGAHTELCTTIRDVLAIVSESVATSKELSLTLGYSPSDPILRLVSSIAAGADQIVAQEALALGYELQCVLPFHAEEYELDFVDPDARVAFNDLKKVATGVLELDGMRVQAPVAYERAGRIMLSHSDLLIAIWNGERGAGRGGTAQIVEEAITRGIPVVWVNSNRPHRYQLILGDTYVEPGDSAISRLKDQIRRVVAPSVEDDPKLRSVYFNLSPVRKSRGWIFRNFRKALLIGSNASKRASEENNREQAELRDDVIVVPMPDCFAADYRRADDLADHFGGLYRDSFVTNYLLAAAAVATALIEGFPGYSWATWVELFFLLFVLWKIHAGRRGCWHERWLNFRILAEELRQASILYPFGRTLRPFRVAAHGEGADPNRLWVNWLARAKVREAGLVTSTLNARSVETYRLMLIARMREQMEYHSRNYARNAVLARRIDNIGIGFFYAAVMAVLVHALAEGVATSANVISRWSALKSYLTTHSGTVSSVEDSTSFLDALFPTIGAAFAGIGSQGEFGKISERSHAMENRLGALISRASSAPLTSYACGLIAEEATDIMTAELLDWHVIFLDKGIEAPV